MFDKLIFVYYADFGDPVLLQADPRGIQRIR